MAEQQDDLVTIHLDEPRQYRDRETYLVHTIGPGQATVPRSTAERWGFDGDDAPLAEPWEGYNALPVGDVVDRLPTLTDDQRAAVLAYERKHKKRDGIIRPLVNWNSRVDEAAKG